MYCLYVGVDNTYIDVNALAQGIKSFLASQVWFQAVDGARTYGTDSPAITSQYVCMYVCMYDSMYIFMYVYVYMYGRTYVCTDVYMYGRMYLWTYVSYLFLISRAN